MEKALSLKPYLLVVKPGIVLGNAITAAGGFALASKGQIDFALFFYTLLGLSLIVASGCTFNNYIDRASDKKMARTQNRPLAKKSISSQSAIIYAIFLGCLGVFLLSFFVNLFAAIAALVGFTVYVLFYSFVKYQTYHATLIGSIAGATPPVVGYCGASHSFDLGAVLLFIILVLWQMPHFYAIAIYRQEEYKKASIPVLPLVKGIQKTKIQMLIYLSAFIISCFTLTIFHYAGIVYTFAAGILGFAWLILAMKGFKAENDKRWARQMFIISLVVITSLFCVIPFSPA